MTIGPTNAHLSPSSPRYPDWLKVFGASLIEIEAPMPILADVPDRGTCEVYKLKLSALTPSQHARLLDHLCGRFHLPVDVVVEALAQDGCPILAEDVVVSFDTRLVV